MNETLIKILIVDDDEDTRGLYADVFRASGFVVMEAKDGLEGLESANADKPDVILSGIIMPRMDGFQFVESLKNSVTTSSIPVAFLSHLGRQEDKNRAEQIGVRDFIVRDIVSPKESVARIRMLVSPKKEYTVLLQADALDAKQLTTDLNIPADFSCEGSGGTHWALRVTVRDVASKTFEATLVCIP